MHLKVNLRFISYNKKSNKGNREEYNMENELMPLFNPNSLKLDITSTCISLSNCHHALVFINGLSIRIQNLLSGVILSRYLVCYVKHSIFRMSCVLATA